METLTYKTKDRSKWGVGPWDNEPDKVQWLDPVSGLPCMIRRGRMGAWCGYVGVSEGHPAYGKDYPEVEADVHGGLTYAAFCEDGADEASGICHVTADHKPVWWLGFDCSHVLDSTPEKMSWNRGPDCEYRDQAYVTDQTLRLAKQLAAMVTP